MTCQFFFYSVDVLVDEGAAVDAKDNNFRTPLHLAALRGGLDCVEILLSNSAELNAKDFQGLTALHLASFNGHLDLLESMFKREGANAVEADEEGRVPLHAAAFAGHTRCCEFLLGRSASINRPDKRGHTAVHYAARMDQRDTLQFLLQACCFLLLIIIVVTIFLFL